MTITTARRALWFFEGTQVASALLPELGPPGRWLQASDRQSKAAVENAPSKLETTLSALDFEDK
jgi:hypothetical protein